MDEKETIEHLRNGRVDKLTDDVGEIKLTIAKMSEKIDHILSKINDMGECYENTQKCLNLINVDLASRPGSKEIRNTISRVDRHETYFKIMGTAITLIAAKLLGLLDFLFK